MNKNIVDGKNTNIEDIEAEDSLLSESNSDKDMQQMFSRINLKITFDFLD